MIFERLYKDELSIALNNSDTSVLYTAARRKQAINDACEEFVDLTECFVRQATIPLSCNTAEYMLLSSGTLGGSTDYMRMAKQGVEYHLTDSNGITRTMSGDDNFPRRDIEWLNRWRPNWRESTHPVEFPESWYLRQDGGNVYLGLTQPPDVGDSQTAQIVVPYVALPAPMTSTSEEPFTVNSSVRTDLRIFHRALPQYAAYKLLPLIGDEDSAATKLQAFIGYVTRYTQSVRPKGGTHTTPARSYFNESRRVSRRGQAATNDSRWGVRD